MPFVRAVDKGVEVDVWVVPRASRSSLGPAEPARDCLRVAVHAPPVDGAANDAVREALAKGLSVAKSQVRLLRGETSRKKTLLVQGEPAGLLARLQELAQGSA
jgi:hypothetical protein